MLLLIIVIWTALGRYFHYSNTWQLVINTATTIGTFLMVSLIQNTQNREARAIHLKLDEIIRAMRQVRNEMIDIDNVPDEELEAMSRTFESIRLECAARKNRKAGLPSHQSSQTAIRMRVVKLLYTSAFTKSKVPGNLVLSSEADCDFYRNG